MNFFSLEMIILYLAGFRDFNSELQNLFEYSDFNQAIDSENSINSLPMNCQLTLNFEIMIIISCQNETILNVQ